MREWQSLLQVLHVYAGCSTELTQSFLRARLSVAAHSFIMTEKTVNVSAVIWTAMQIKN